MSQSGSLRISDSNLPPDVPLVFIGNTGSGASAINHIIYVLGTGGASVDTSGQTITINVASTAMTWNVVTSANNPVNLTANNGYIAKGASPVQFILPASASIGDTFKIIGYGNLWTIAQNAGQSITIGMLTSTAGVLGGVTATMISDGIELINVTPNLEFYETDIQGNPTIF